jgi:hypothetical protein
MENKKTKSLINPKVYQIDKPLQMVKMATILKYHIIKNKLFVTIAGKDYVMVEGWQFAGGMIGSFPRVVDVKEIGKEKWLAKVEVVNQKTKEVISSGFALCSKEEGKKKTFDEYAILSMAQTRAIGKAYRNVIGWVMKLAGYESTPAEEMKKAGDVKTTQSTTEKAGSLMASETDIERIKVVARELGLNTIEKIEKKTGLVINFKGMTKNQASKIYAELLKIKVA